MDINVVQSDHNQVTVFTSSGIQLVGIAAATLTFDAQGSMTADGAMERRSEPARPSAPSCCR